MYKGISNFCIFITFLMLLYPAVTVGVQCPNPPEQVKKDWEVEVNAAIVKIGPAKGGELKTKTRNATQDLLSRLPEAGKIYLEQMLFSAYCSALRDDKTMREAEKAELLKEYGSELRRTIAGYTTTSKDKAKAERNISKISAAKLADVLIEKTDHGTAILDIRVVNERNADIFITKIKLVPIKSNIILSKGPVDYSKVYAPISIDALREKEPPLEIPVSQVVPASKVDRFGVEVGSTHPHFVKGKWKFQLFLVTSAGELGGKILELSLP